MADLSRRCHSDPEWHQFEQSLIALMPLLRAHARSWTNQPADADDLVQEAVLKAFKSRHKFIPGTSLKSWVFVIARNLFLSGHRRLKWHAEWDPEAMDLVLTSDGDILEAEASVDFHRLLRCMACLERDRRDALVAVGYLGLSYEDAAERLGSLVGTIKSRVARGRNDLAALYESEERIPQVNISSLQKATQGIPRNHRLFPIAKGYEDLYSTFSDESCETPDTEGDHEKAWNDLVASGALDFDAEDFDDLL